MFQENIIPVRFCKNGLLICKRLKVTDQRKNISAKLKNDVYNTPNETEIKPNIVYAVRSGSRPWRRGVLKFIRSSDGVPVMEFLDVNGVLDFQEGCTVRKICNQNISKMLTGIFKMFIYGIHVFDPDHEFDLIFHQLLKDKQISAIFALIEEKENLVHNCFAGDLFYKANDKLMSFRELIIREKVSYPSMRQSVINRKIFEATSAFLKPVNGLLFTKIQNATDLQTTAKTLVQQSRDLIPTFDSQVDEFGLIEIIGEGSYGVVYKGWSIPRQEFVAIKIFRSSEFGMTDKKEVEFEANILCTINNKHVIQLYELKDSFDQFYLVFPFYPKDLDKFIYDEEYIHDNARTKKIIFMILSGLRGLHNIGIVHRDIKPSNVLINIDGTDVKICDLGLASQKAKMMAEVGTQVYNAPEMFLRIGYDKKVDVWATGCILTELILKKRIIGYSKSDQLDEIFKVFGTPKSFEWPYKTYRYIYERNNFQQLFQSDADCHDFFNSIMSLNPNRRCDAADALKMAYLANNW